MAKTETDIVVYPVVTSVVHNPKGTRCAIYQGERVLANVVDIDAAALYIRRGWRSSSRPKAWLVDRDGDMRTFMVD